MRPSTKFHLSTSNPQLDGHTVDHFATTRAYRGAGPFPAIIGRVAHQMETTDPPNLNGLRCIAPDNFCLYKAELDDKLEVLRSNHGVAMIASKYELRTPDPGSRGI